MLPEQQLNAWRLELAVTAKNGLNFILAANLIWAAIAFIWTLPYPPARLSFFTFFVGPALLPLAWLLSKVLRTTWTVPHNPLQPLGLWLNVAQLLYFPFLIFIYSKHPAYFLMTYGIITGAHFSPTPGFTTPRPTPLWPGLSRWAAYLSGCARRLRHPSGWRCLWLAGSLLVLSALLLGSYRRYKAAYSLLTVPA